MLCIAIRRTRRALLEVLDHWDRVGDWSQQWLNLRYAARFLVRVGAEEDAVALHYALVVAGRLSPLGPSQLDGLGDQQAESLSASDALLRARVILTRFA